MANKYIPNEWHHQLLQNPSYEANNGDQSHLGSINPKLLHNYAQDGKKNKQENNREVVERSY